MNQRHDPRFLGRHQPPEDPLWKRVLLALPGLIFWGGACLVWVAIPAALLMALGFGVGLGLYQLWIWIAPFLP